MKKIGLKALSWALSLTMLMSMAALPAGAAQTNDEAELAAAANEAVTETSTDVDEPADSEKKPSLLERIADSVFDGEDERVLFDEDEPAPKVAPHPSGYSDDDYYKIYTEGDYQYTVGYYDINDVYIWKYTGNATKITIPSTINGKPVKSIGNYAFDGCTGLTSIEIPDSVTSIGRYAFKGCTGLTSIEIPDSVTTIGDGVFDGCTVLTDVYYEGTQEQWNNVSGTSYVSGKTIHYNSAMTVTPIDPDDPEMLGDLVLAAVNDGLSKVDKATESTMGKYTKGIPGM